MILNGAPVTEMPSVNHVTMNNRNGLARTGRETSRSASSSGERELFAIFSGLRVVSMAKKAGQNGHGSAAAQSAMAATLGVGAGAATGMRAAATQSHFEGDGDGAV